MPEMIDIYDANLAHIGVMERLEAHMQGQWHVTFHCWLVTREVGGQILFQARSPDMVNFPNLLDVSAAGHLAAGETVAAGIREVEEELGIEIPPGSLHSLGHRVEVADQENGQHNREYQSVHAAAVDEPLSHYRPQVEEVHGLLWLSVADGLQLFAKDKDEAVMHGIQYHPETAGWVEVERVVSRDDFLPRIQNYYLTACIMADRLVRGEFPLAIS